MNHQLHKEKVLEILLENKHLVEKHKEDEIVALSKRTFADKEYLNEISNRLYKDAERRIKAKEIIMNFSKVEEEKNLQIDEQAKSSRVIIKDDEKCLTSAKDRIITDYSNKTIGTVKKSILMEVKQTHKVKNPGGNTDIKPKEKHNNKKNDKKLKNTYDYDRIIREDDKDIKNQSEVFHESNTSIKNNLKSFEGNSLIRSNDHLKGIQNNKKIISDIQAVKLMDKLFSSK